MKLITDLEQITYLLQNYYDKEGKSKYSSFEILKERINTILQDKNFEITGLTNKNDITYSIVILNNKTLGRIEKTEIIFIYTINEYKNAPESEIDLLKGIFTEKKRIKDSITFEVNLDNDKTEDFLIREGFKVIKRVNMSISKKIILDLSENKIPENISIIPFDSDLVETCARLMVDVNKNHIDSEIYPEFTDYTASKNMILEFIKNKYGTFYPNLSFVIKKFSDFIGYCFNTIFDKKIGFILDIGILPEYRGLGLGKLLIIYSLKELLVKQPNISEIELAVTLKNKNAVALYKKLGFKISREFNSIIWNK